MARPLITKPSVNGTLSKIPGKPNLVGPVEGDIGDLFVEQEFKIVGGIFQKEYIATHDIPANVYTGTIDQKTAKFLFAEMPHAQVAGSQKQVIVWLIPLTAGTPTDNEFDSKKFTVTG
jgi:hypothetical protein